ncbi:aspartic peptidase domain-containing protein [Aspergillus aurantiobrunneus]
MFQTGSSDIILPKKGCTTCGKHNQFDPAKSTSFSPMPGNVSKAEFNTAGTTKPLKEFVDAKCTTVTDTVTYDPLVVHNQTLRVCENLPQDLWDSPIDGIVGLAPAPQSNISLPFFWNLYYSGQLAEPQVSLYTPPGQRENAAEMTFGGIDHSKYKGDIYWVDISKDARSPAMNVVELQNVYINSTEALVPRFVRPSPSSSAALRSRSTSTSTAAASISTAAESTSTPAASASVSTSASTSTSTAAASASASAGLAPVHAQPALSLMDTGTAFIQPPTKEATAALYKQISPKIKQIDPAGAWGAPCETLDAIAPSLKFIVGHGSQKFTLVIEPKYFNLGEYPGKPGICQAVFNSPVIPTGINEKPMWILGSPVLKTFYSIYDGLHRKIGFAETVESFDSPNH